MPKVALINSEPANRRFALFAIFYLLKRIFSKDIFLGADFLLFRAGARFGEHLVAD